MACHLGTVEGEWEEEKQEQQKAMAAFLAAAASSATAASSLATPACSTMCTLGILVIFVSHPLAHHATDCVYLIICMM